MSEQRAVMPAELAKTTAWSRESWQHAYDAVAADGRLAWSDVVIDAVTSGQGPSIAFNMISMLDGYPQGAQQTPVKWWQVVLDALFWLFWIAVGILVLTAIGAVLFTVLDWLLS